MAEYKKKGKLGAGTRFDALSSLLDKDEGIRDPDALTASIGRKTYGKTKFQALAAAGRRRAARRK